MPRFNLIQIEFESRTWSGREEQAGDHINVDSAWGSARVRVGKADPGKAARAALEELVKDWIIGRRS